MNHYNCVSDYFGNEEGWIRLSAELEANWSEEKQRAALLDSEDRWRLADAPAAGISSSTEKGRQQGDICTMLLHKGLLTT